MTLKEPLEAAKPDLAPAPPVAVAPPISVATASAASRDRRRPGRPDQASPHLIPLLRTSEIEGAAAANPADELPLEDALAPAKGIAVGLLLSVPVWAVIGMIVWEVL